MKKLFVIMLLCATTVGCAGQHAAHHANGVLLSYQDLATEITVGLEQWTDDAVDRPVEDPLLGTP
jgi:hypothetical protein